MVRRKKDDVMSWCEELAKETIETGDKDFLKELFDALNENDKEYV